MLPVLPAGPAASHAPKQLPRGLRMAAAVCRSWRDVVNGVFRSEEWRQLHLEDARDLLRRNASDEELLARLAIYPQDAERIEHKGVQEALWAMPDYIVPTLTMHMRVSVWWDAEGEWFEGVVLGHSVPTTGRWADQLVSTIRYDDDGEIKRHSLRNDVHRWLSLPIHEALWQRRSSRIIHALAAHTSATYWTCSGHGVERVFMHEALRNIADALELPAGRVPSPKPSPSRFAVSSLIASAASAASAASSRASLWRTELLASVEGVESWLAGLDD